MKISEILEEYLDSKSLEQGCLPSTIRAYRYDLQMFQKEIGDLDIESLKIFHIRKFIKSLGDKNYSKRGIARKIACLKSFFKFCLTNDIIDTNIMDKIQNPKTRSENILPKYLEEQEIVDLLTFLKEKKYLGKKGGIRLYPIIRLMYAIMARVSEICNISLKDINFEGNTIRLFGKGGKQRIVPFDEETSSVLKDMILDRMLSEPRFVKSFAIQSKEVVFSEFIKTNGDLPLFMNQNGKRITSRVIQHDLKVMREMFAGTSKKITAHVFRHTGATHLRQNGMDLSELQDLLGHASPNTTRIYAKNDVSLLKKSYEGKHPLSKN